MRNDFAFSFSGWKTFRRCPREWWLSKVLFWEGWLRSSPQRVRLAYGLTKLQTFYTLAGNVIHTLAEEIIRRPDFADAERLMAAFTRRFDLAIAESRSGDWAQDPKRVTNLFEHYYSYPRAAETEERARASGLRSAMNLPTSGALRRAPRGEILQAEVLEKFQVAGIPVWVKLDLAYREGGLVYLNDYKTGRPKPEHRAQGGLYALFWTEQRDTPLEDVRLALDYLGEGREEVVQPLADEIDEMRAGIVEAASTMMERLAPARGGVLLNVGAEEDFPGVDDPEVCSSCHLFHACKGTRSIPFERAA